MTCLKKRTVALLMAILILCVACLGSCGERAGVDEGHTDDSTAESATTPGETLPSEEAGPVVLAENGEYRYRVVYPRKQKNGEQEAAASLVSAMRVIFGSEPKNGTDVMKYEKDTLEIYVGLLGYEESQAAHEAIGYGDYSITQNGNKIVIAAYESNILQLAVNSFIADMKAGSTADVLLLPTDFTKTKTVVPMLSAVPKLGTDIPKLYCVADSSSYTYVLENCKESRFDDYKTAIAGKGFTAYASQTLADNSFATYHNDLCVVNLSYFPAKKTLHVAIDSKKYTAMPETSATAFDSVGDTELTLLGVSGSGNDENGLSMFMRLADGRFLIWDGGGTEPERDAENLYNQLKASAEEVGLDKVVIAAWMLTHSHGDHANTYLSFLPKYGAQVELQKLIISPTTYEYGAAARDGAQFEANVMTQTIFKSKNTSIIIARTGQRFYFADVTVDILYTLDALMPMDFTDYNLASIVSRVERNGKILITTGDCATAGWNFICDVYGEYENGTYLDCDYLQIPHHGAVPGGTVEAYNLLKPDYLLWPAGPSVFETITGSGYKGYEINLHVLDEMGLRDHTYLADLFGTVTTLTFG